jgi:glucose-6-phosphate isomerase
MVKLTTFFSGEEYRDAVSDAMDCLRRNNIVSRILARDYTVWKSTPNEIVNRLDWLTAPAETLTRMQDIRSILDPLIKDGLRDAVLLGMGGSSLAAAVFNDVFGNRRGYPRLHILDTTDPAAIAGVARNLTIEKTIFLVSSKSGTTLETSSLFQYFYNLVLHQLGSAAGSRFIFITDAGSSMVELAGALSVRHTFLNNPAIGGRYSALSLPGIVPAAFIGIDVEELLQRALAAAEKETAGFLSGELQCSGSALGTILGVLAQKGRDKLTLILPARLISFGNWIEQLIAESTGKEGKGILPIVNEPLADPGSYSNDRVFVIFRDDPAELSPAAAVLAAAGHPVITMRLDDDYDLGAQMFFWEMAVAVAGHVLGINPFDQPDVETTKKQTRNMIAIYRDRRELPEEPPTLTTPECRVYGQARGSSVAGVLKNFLDQARESDYVSLQIYLSPTHDIDVALEKLRAAIFARYRLAVTLAYGPRYLHSTGQLHKGDAGRGLFIQFTAGDSEDLEIPDRAGFSGSSLTFGTLKSAQAIGDWRALIELGRRIIRFHLDKNIAATIESMGRNLSEI